MELTIQSALPSNSISDFVHSFWLVENNTGKDFQSTVLPTGMVDLILMKAVSGKWEMFMMGIDTMPSEVTITAGIRMFSIGFKLLAVEYLFGDSIKEILNGGKELSNDFWQFEENDLENIESFCARATQKITTVTPEDIDNRKKKLFELIYAHNGSMSVQELSEKVNWSSRQINRYFNDKFGISLKTYCNVLRSGASFKAVSEGKLFPELNFTDQNHFIKEIKKHTGVTPKELSRNKDERFINITAIKKFPKNG